MLKGPIARGTFRTSAVLSLRLFVQAGTLLLVARLLGPSDYGAFAGVSSLAVILGTLSTFGLHLVLLGEMSRDPARRAHVLARAIPATLACGTLLLAVFLLVCLGALQEARMPLQVLLAIGITEILLQPLFNLPASELLAHGRAARSQMVALFPLMLRLVAVTGVFLLTPAKPLAVYGFAYIAASLTALAIVSFVMPEPWPAPRVWRWPTRAEWREAAGYAALNVTALSPAELDKTLAAKLLPLPVTGVYAAGQRVIGAATLPVVAMLLSALPRLFREGHDGHGRTRRLLHWIFAATIGYSLALSCALWLCTPIFAWLFGHRYAGIDHMLHWLVPSIPGMAVRTAAGSALMALGKPWMRVGFEIAGLAALAVASVLLTGHFGAIGMPLALACSEWTMATAGVLMLFTSTRGIGSNAACH